MEENQAIAIVVLIVVVGGAGVLLLISPSDTTYQSDYTEILESACYIIAEGTFDFIDVYTIDTLDGSYCLDFQTHVTISDMKYNLPNPSTDYGDQNYADYDYVYRIELWICIDGNLTTVWFPVSSEIVYEVTFLDIDFTIYINESRW